MKIIIYFSAALIALVSATPSRPQYQFYFRDALTSINTNNWTQAGRKGKRPAIPTTPMAGYNPTHLATIIMIPTQPPSPLRWTVFALAIAGAA